MLGTLDTLVSSLLVELTKLNSEVLEAEALFDLELIEVHRRDEGRELGQRVTTGTADTDEESVATLHVEHAIDPGHVDNGISKEDDVHRLHLLLRVEPFELSIEEITEFAEVSDLFIHLLLLILDEEVDEDSITRLARHAVLSVVHLQLLLELAIEK